MTEKHPKRPRDPNQLAKSIIDIATGQKPDRDPTPEEQGKSAVAVSTGSRLRAQWRLVECNSKRSKQPFTTFENPTVRVRAEYNSEALR
jgi:hypothetical protein